jgi:hypothetical protein
MSNHQKTENPMGAGKKQALRVTFDSRLKLEFHGSKVTSDAGLLAYRELDEALGLTDLADGMLNDWRTGTNTQHSMVALTRQSIFSRLAGYEDTNDAERLSVDPTIRLPANDALMRDIEPMLTRPVGRPSNVPVVWYAGFLYQAKSWDRARRVVAKVEWHSGELFPRVGFIVTNLTRPAKQVVRFYNQRGTAEQWIKEGKNAVKWTRLSCHDFVDNQVRLQLFVLAYNLGNFLRQAVLPQSVRHWTLTTLREKLIKIGAKVVRHSRQIVFQMAEVAVPRDLFRAILEGIGRLRLATVLSG